jgi:Uncharacterized protein conserved in bacteria
MPSALLRRMSAAVVFSVLCAPGVTLAQEFPSKPITLVIPQAPGSGSDVVGRLLANAMAPAIGQTIIAENRPGAGGIIAHQSVKRAAPDGYTVMFSSTAQLLVVPTMNSAAQYTVEDFTPVAPVLWAPFAVLVANTPEAPKSMQELLDTIKTKQTAYASAGVGTMTHLGTESILRRAGLESTHVPYQGSGAALTDLMSGQVLFATDSLTAAMRHINSGKLRALAVTGEAREASLPDVPTLNEVGLQGPPIGVLGGIFAPKGVPDAVVKKLKASVDAALQDAKVQEQFKNTETTVLSVDSDTFVKRLNEQAPFWQGLVAELGLKGQ